MMAPQLARRAAQELLSRTRGGQIVLVENGRELTVGAPAADGLAARVTIREPRFYNAVLRGSVGLAQSYSEGAWDADDLVVLFRIGARNMHRFDSLRQTLRPAMAIVRYLGTNGRRN